MKANTDSLEEILKDNVMPPITSNAWQYSQLLNKLESLIKAKQLELLERVNREIIGDSESLSDEQIANGRIYKVGDPVGDGIDRFKDKQRKALDTLRGELCLTKTR